MKLYTSLKAPNPRRVAWFLAEKGVSDIETVDLDLMKGEQKAADYIAKVGAPMAPALELDDGVVIAESVAICRYLESLYPDPNLFGRDAEDIAVIEMWTRRAELMLANPLMLAARHGHPALKALEDPQIPEVSGANLALAHAALPLFERQLDAHAFIAGGRMTMADIVAITGLEFGRLARFKLPESFPNLARWRTDMLARPAAAAGV